MKKLLERIMKDEKKREKLFILMTFGPIVASVLVVIGFIVFIIKLAGII